MASRWSSSAPDEPVLNSDREKAHSDQPGHFFSVLLRARSLAILL